MARFSVAIVTALHPALLLGGLAHTSTLATMAAAAQAARNGRAEQAHAAARDDRNMAIASDLLSNYHLSAEGGKAIDSEQACRHPIYYF